MKSLQHIEETLLESRIKTYHSRGNPILDYTLGFAFGGAMEYVAHHALHQLGMKENPDSRWGKLVKKLGIKTGKDSYAGFHFHIHHKEANAAGMYDRGYGPAEHLQEQMEHYLGKEGESQNKEKNGLFALAVAVGISSIALQRPFFILGATHAAIYYHHGHKEAHINFSKAEEYWSSHLDHHRPNVAIDQIIRNMGVTTRIPDHVCNTRSMTVGTDTWEERRIIEQERFNASAENYHPDKVVDATEEKTLYEKIKKWFSFE